MADLTIWQLPLLVLAIMTPITAIVAGFFAGMIAGEWTSDLIYDFTGWDVERPITFLGAVTGVATAIVLILWAASRILT